MRDIALIIILFGSLPIILFRPYVGVLVWSWLGYMNPHRLSWAMQEFPVASVVAATLLVGLVFGRESKKIPWTPVTGVWVFFVVWMSVTTLFALVPEHATEHWVKMIKIQLISFVTLMLMRDKDRLNWLVVVIVLSLGFYGVKGGLFTAMTGGNYRVWGPPGTFIEGNNEIALALVMTIPLMYYLQAVYEQKWIKYGLRAMILLSALAVLGSYSRGAFLASAAMVLFLVMKSHRKALFFIAAAVAIPIMLAFMPEQWHERMGTIKDYREDASAMGRINAWWFAYNVAKDRPLVGGGFEVFEPPLFQKYAPVPEDFHDAHSIYFEILGEHGFFGLFLFLLLGWLAFRSCSWVIRRGRGVTEIAWARHLAAMTQVSLIGYAVGGAFLGLAYFDLYYHLVALAVLTRVLVEQVLARLPERGARDIFSEGPQPASPSAVGRT